MFNGKNLDDWQVKIRNQILNENYGNTFRVNDGNIQVRYDAYDTFDEQFGHLFYNYYFYFGKLIGWILIPFSIFWIEVAMIEAHWNQKTITRAKKLYRMKLLLVYLVFMSIWVSVDVLNKPHLLFLPIAINSILGLLIGVGVFSYQFKKKISASFATIFFGIAIIFPSAFIFIFKINIHQWFSKNDFSHILMIIGIIFFYLGVKKILKEDHGFLKIK
mgnify:CR=1 FL=1